MLTARSITGALAAAAIVAVVPCTFVQAAPPETAPKPAAEMSSLKFFDGSWTCSGEALPTPMGPGGKMTGAVKSHTDLGGFWQSGTVKTTGGGMPAGMEGMFHMTYDPGAKQYMLLWVDSMGGHSQETSTGWEGDKIVFSGESAMGAQKMMVRDTFTKAADGSMKHDWEGQFDGKWTPMGNETCKKGAAPAKK